MTPPQLRGALVYALLATLLCVLIVATAAPVRGQTATDLLGQGVAAYRSLEYERASSLFKRSLAVSGGRALPDTTRAEAFTYLAAAELFCNRADSAAVAFRESLALSPRYRPDTLIFPPKVTKAFEAARRTTAFVRVRAPLDTTIVVGTDRYVFELFASGPHDVNVSLVRPDGQRKALFTGRINESLTVPWDGMDAAGIRALDGNLVVVVRSTASDASVREVRMPLLVAMSRQPAPVLRTAAAPPTSAVSSPRRGSTVGMIAAVAASALVVALPAIVSDGESGTPLRFGVSASLATVAVLGFTRRGGSRPPLAQTPPVQRPDIVSLRIVAGRQETPRSSDGNR